jgi:hypothetical protein
MSQLTRILNHEWIPFTWLNYYKNLLESFTIFLIIPVTSFYVVFSYYLWKTTFEVNQQKVIPFMCIQWIPEFYGKPELVFSVDPELIYLPEELEIDRTWAAIKIYNNYEKPITWFHITIKAEFLRSEIKHKKKLYPFVDQTLKLEKDKVHVVAVWNLDKLKRTSRIKFIITAVSYTAETSKMIYNEFAFSDNSDNCMVVDGKLDR